MNAIFTVSLLIIAIAAMGTESGEFIKYVFGMGLIHKSYSLVYKWFCRCFSLAINAVYSPMVDH